MRGARNFVIGKNHIQRGGRSRKQFLYIQTEIFTFKNRHICYPSKFRKVQARKIKKSTNLTKFELAAPTIGKPSHSKILDLMSRGY